MRNRPCKDLLCQMLSTLRRKCANATLLMWRRQQGRNRGVRRHVHESLGTGWSHPSILSGHPSGSSLKLTVHKQVLYIYIYMTQAD